MDQAYRTKSWPWYVWGPTGVGKSCAVAALYERWPDAIFLYAPQFIPDFVHARVEHRAGGMLNSLRDASLVFLDDVATREMTVPQTEALLLTLEKREGKPLIMTGNLSPQKLGECLDDRIASRICAGVVIEINGPDRRLEKTVVIKV